MDTEQLQASFSATCTESTGFKANYILIQVMGHLFWLLYPKQMPKSYIETKEGFILFVQWPKKLASAMDSQKL